MWSRVSKHFGVGKKKKYQIPEIYTDWMKMCGDDRITKNDILDRLESDGYDVIPYRNLSKREICKKFALQVGGGDDYPISHNECHSPTELTGYDWRKGDIHIIEIKGRTWCFSTRDLIGIKKSGYVNPFTRERFDKNTITRVDRIIKMDELNQGTMFEQKIYEEKPAGRMYPNIEILIKFLDVVWPGAVTPQSVYNRNLRRMLDILKADGVINHNNYERLLTGDVEGVFSFIFSLHRGRDVNHTDISSSQIPATLKNYINEHIDTFAKAVGIIEDEENTRNDEPSSQPENYIDRYLVLTSLPENPPSSRESDFALPNSNMFRPPEEVDIPQTMVLFDVTGIPRYYYALRQKLFQSVDTDSASMIRRPELSVLNKWLAPSDDVMNRTLFSYNGDPKVLFADDGIYEYNMQGGEYKLLHRLFPLSTLPTIILINGRRYVIRNITLSYPDIDSDTDDS